MIGKETGKKNNPIIMRPGKWTAGFFGIVCSLFMIFSLVVYVVDPFFQFRVKDHSYMLNGWFVSGGLIENYDYDTLIIGSSMTQNFDMDKFRDKLEVNPLHIGLGGINRVEIQDFMRIAYQVGKADQYYICTDLTAFTDDTHKSRYPAYLLRQDMLSRVQYFLSYEAWFRYMPVDMALLAANKAGVGLPEKFRYKMSVDRLGDWGLEYKFGKDIVIDNYINERYAVSQVDTTDLYKWMTEHIDWYLDMFDFDKGEHIFFFPPYSSLYWCDAQEKEYFHAYLMAKQYFMKKARERGVHTIYDFQSAVFTMDLDNYKDTTHFAPKINDWMIECFAKEDYMVTDKNMEKLQQNLIKNTQAFKESYPELFVNQKACDGSQGLQPHVDEQG